MTETPVTDEAETEQAHTPNYWRAEVVGSSEAETTTVASPDQTKADQE